MFDKIRKSMVRHRVLEEISRLDRHLREDIGLGDVGGNPERHDPVLLMTRGPFERYSR